MNSSPDPNTSPSMIKVTKNHALTSWGQSSNQSHRNQQRAAKVRLVVENNDVEQFRILMLSRRDCLHMRFNYNMNLLQLVCFEEANLILDAMRYKFVDDEAAKI